jgi:peptide/nickel transport system substrate-binding protein
VLPSAAAREIREGGTFRIVLAATEFDHIDPALAYTAQSFLVLDPTCARLMNYPDRPPPAGYRLEPEVAAGHPRISRDGKTYTFTLRPGFRFSDGTPVRASAFARAIDRLLAPAMKSPGAQYVEDIVGAKAVKAGRAARATGVVARGNRLVVRFRRATPGFAAQTTMPFFCAVPPSLPADPEGVGAFPGAGPYYVAEYRPGQRIVLRRNRHYRGKRPHHVDGFHVDLTADSPQELVGRVERGGADWGFTGPPFYFDPDRRLVAKYGVNKSRFFVQRGNISQGYVFNNSRPLFRDNVRLRQAVNFAVNRAALRAAAGGRLVSELTDQYLPPSLPAFRESRIYPLGGPNLQRARALARGRTRGGRAVLYTFDDPFARGLAQVLKRNLAKIGLRVEIRGVPLPVYFQRIARRDEPFDIAFFVWQPDYPDPYGILNVLLDGRFIGGTNYARFDSGKYNRLLRRAAGLRGSARRQAYGGLDVQLARDAAPMIPVEYNNAPTLVSERTGCIVLRPYLDLTAACLD